MLKKLIKALKIVAISTSVIASSGFAQTTSDVWQHHIQAWTSRSALDIAADYSDESVLILHNNIYKGRAEIANVFMRLFRIFDDGINQIETPIILDRFVYITWNFAPTGQQTFFGTDTSVIENGKIVLQTIASTLYDAFPIARL